MSVGDFAERVAVLAIRHKFSVISWGRSEAHNESVGGLPESLHRLFLAVDVKLDPGETVADLARSCARIGLQLIEEPGSIHIQAPRP